LKGPEKTRDTEKYCMAFPTLEL